MENIKFRLFGFAIRVFDIDQSVKYSREILGFQLLNKIYFPAVSAQCAFIQGLGIRLELLQAHDSFRVEALFAQPPAHLKVIGNKALIVCTRSS